MPPGSCTEKCFRTGTSLAEGISGDTRLFALRILFLASHARSITIRLQLLVQHDIDGMVRPIVVNGGATRNSSSKLLSFGSEECSIGAERMSDWLSKKMVTCNIPSSIAEICPVTRRRTSRFCFTEADHRKVASLWILSGGSRGGSPLRSLTRCVRAMFPVAAHLLDTDFRLFLRVGT